MRQIADAISKANDENALQLLLAAHAEHLERESRRFARMHRHLGRWLGCTSK